MLNELGGCDRLNKPAGCDVPEASLSSASETSMSSQAAEVPRCLEVFAPQPPGRADLPPPKALLALETPAVVPRAPPEPSGVGMGGRACVQTYELPGHGGSEKLAREEGSLWRWWGLWLGLEVPRERRSTIKLGARWATDGVATGPALLALPAPALIPVPA